MEGCGLGDMPEELRDIVLDALTPAECVRAVAAIPGWYTRLHGSFRMSALLARRAASSTAWVRAAYRAGAQWQDWSGPLLSLLTSYRFLSAHPPGLMALVAASPRPVREGLLFRSLGNYPFNWFPEWITCGLHTLRGEAVAIHLRYRVWQHFWEYVSDETVDFSTPMIVSGHVPRLMSALAAHLVVAPRADLLCCFLYLPLRDVSIRWAFELATSRCWTVLDALLLRALETPDDVQRRLGLLPVFVTRLGVDFYSFPVQARLWDAIFALPVSQAAAALELVVERGLLFGPTYRDVGSCALPHAGRVFGGSIAGSVERVRRLPPEAFAGLELMVVKAVDFTSAQPNVAELILGMTLHDVMRRAGTEDWDALETIESVLGCLPSVYTRWNRWGRLDRVVVSYASAKRAIHDDWPTSQGGGASPYLTRHRYLFRD